MASVCSDESLPVWGVLLTFGISLRLWDCNFSQHKKLRRGKKTEEREKREKPEKEETRGKRESGGNYVREKVAGKGENEAEMRPQK